MQNNRVVVFLSGLMLLSSMLLLSACATGRGSGGEISVGIEAGKNLNTYDRKPHTLVMTIYQLTETESFKDLLRDPESVPVLLEGKQFDGSVLAHHRLVVQPGDKEIKTFGKESDVRYIGVVAGFFDQRPNKFVKIISLEKRRKANFFWASGGKGPDIALLLGANEVVDKYAETDK